MSNELFQELEQWFGKQNPWLQYAAKTLYQNGEITDHDYEQMKDLCIKEANGTLKDSDYHDIKLSTPQVQGNEIKIKEIKDVEGINKLNPQEPLAFEDGKQLSIIYGPNGSGKSGYVRLLKHLTGSRNPGKLLPDVFQGGDISQRCTIDTTVDGNKKEFQWEKGIGPIDELRPVDIYDTFSGQTYISSESEVTYEPPLLVLFSDLAEAEKNLNEYFIDLKRQYPSKKPELPEKFNETNVGKAINNLSHKTNPENIKESAQWTEKDEERLQGLRKQLSEKLPHEKAKEFFEKHKQVIALILQITNLTKVYSSGSLKEICDFLEKVLQKEKAAKAAAEKAFKDAPLQGIGSDVWNELWEKARAYSEGYAYPDETFPYTGEDARCVLCQQPLKEDDEENAKQRLISFEEFVKGETRKEADKLRKEYNEIIESLPEIPKHEHIESKIKSTSIEDEEIIEQTKGFLEILQSRKEQISSGNPFDEIKAIPDYWDLLKKARSFAHQFHRQGMEYYQSATASTRVKINKEISELEAKKWLSENLTSILDEVERLKVIHELNLAQGKVKTGRISKKKGKIAEDLITENYKDRFNNELKALNAGNIRVELDKSRTKEGRVLHQIKLQNLSKNDVKPEEILSEGENRIVSLAAFLADVTGNPYYAPIIFDDPISSLDQEYEGFVAKRLALLAKERQVLVFTHRLSMLGLLQEKVKKLEDLALKFIGLRNEKWGSGNPAELPIHKNNPEKSLNKLLNERLSSAKKVLEEQGQEQYEVIAQGICSDLRLTIERIIERRLLSDVVERFSRVIHSDKIKELSKISQEDCEKLDNMMSKYSEFEHSQPVEAPQRVLEPDEIENDINDLLTWCKDFKDRKTH